MKYRLPFAVVWPWPYTVNRAIDRRTPMTRELCGGALGFSALSSHAPVPAVLV